MTLKLYQTEFSLQLNKQCQRQLAPIISNDSNIGNPAKSRFWTSTDTRVTL